MIWEPGEDIGEPRLRIDVIELASLCRPSNYAERVCFSPDFSLTGV
jgi:hypothetical protein